MASLRERNGWYQVIFRFGGKQHTFSLKTGGLNKAQISVATIELNLERIQNGLLPAPEPEWGTAEIAYYLLNDGKKAPTVVDETTLTLARLRELYLAAHERSLEPITIKTMIIHFRHLLEFLGETTLVTSLKTYRLQEYITHRSKSVQPQSAGKEIISLRTAWNWAHRSELCDRGFPKGLAHPRQNEKPPFQTRADIELALARGGPTSLWERLFLTREEVLDVLTQIKSLPAVPWLYPMVATAAMTGARRSELLRMLVDDIDWQRGFLTVREKKRKRGKDTLRRVPISGQLAVVLKEWLAIHPGGRNLFVQSGTIARSNKRSPKTGQGRRKKRTDPPKAGSGPAYSSTGTHHDR